MKTYVNQKTFLATSSKKFFKVGLGTSIFFSIVAFQIPFARNSDPLVHIEEEMEKDIFQITYVKLPEEKIVEKKETVVEKKITNPIIITTTAPIDPLPEPKPLEPTPPSTLVFKPEIAPPAVTINKDYEIVEIMPSFLGGEKALFEFIKKSVKYDEKALNLGIEGKVYVRFVINKEGEVTKAEVAKGVHPLLDNEALRVVKNLPNWKPGIQNGEKVNVVMVLPINFTIL